MNRSRLRRVRQFFRAQDHAASGLVAPRRRPGAGRVLPLLSRSTDPGLMWIAIGAGIWALGGARGRRAAVRGAVSLALASATATTIGKGAVRHARPVPDTGPTARQLHEHPLTTSFPSGHAASAAAFAAGVAMEARGLGAVLAPVAASVAFSRVHSGDHRPRDVLVGAALGVGAAFAVRGLVPSRAQLPPPARPRADAPALPEGKGLTVVVNASSGAQPQLVSPVQQLRTALPQADIVIYEPDSGPLTEVLAEAARNAARSGGALGVCGGDGTVNAGAAAALSFDVPLAVLPGGTFNHFAADLGADTIADACAAVEAGSAVRADVGRIRPLVQAGGRFPDRHVLGPPAAEPSYFLNTFSIGVYPDLVRIRERWSPRIGGPLSALLALFQVLRTTRPVRARVNGKRRSIWLLFAGNGAYRSFGVAPARRHDLADGLLDVRIAHGGHLARPRLLATALAGGAARKLLYAAARPRRLVVSELPEGTQMAYDGETRPAPSALVIDKLDEALTVYRPAED
ncbi:diacylglycerol kinase family protein [Streptomyces sp. NPDC002133]|uniref:bifunctional phosphatase PAP2/diacylglycerol kinase family protein n=1 Tax=Streptomyces sp. NPDC002133 TaxID=3154409 RepID=UPI003318FFB8